MQNRSTEKEDTGWDFPYTTVILKEKLFFKDKVDILNNKINILKAIIITNRNGNFYSIIFPKRYSYKDNHSINLIKVIYSGGYW